MPEPTIRPDPVAAIVAGLLRRFGDDAIAVAGRQHAAADDPARGTWGLILAGLEASGGASG